MLINKLKKLKSRSRSMVVWVMVRNGWVGDVVWVMVKNSVVGGVVGSGMDDGMDGNNLMFDLTDRQIDICDSRVSFTNENIAKYLTLTAEFSSFLTMTMMEW